MSFSSRALGVFFTSAFCALLFVASAQAQTITINEARNQGVGATVTVEGTVTRALGAYTRLQDTSGPTGASAIVIRQTSGSFFDDVADSTIPSRTAFSRSTAPTSRATPSRGRDRFRRRRR